MTFDTSLAVHPPVDTGVAACACAALRADPAAPPFASPLPTSLYRGVLDQIGHGVIILGPTWHLRYANPVAMRVFGGAITLSNGRVTATRTSERDSLLRAFVRASSGLRTVLCLGAAESTLVVAIVPLSGVVDGAEEGGVLVLSGREESADPLVVQLFARDHALTDAESRVLAMLCAGTRPNDIAIELGVARSTVRTHLYTIRSKTHARSLFDLMRRVAMLPPMASALAAGGRQQLGLEFPGLER